MGKANAPVRIPDDALNSHSIEIWKDEAVNYGMMNSLIFCLNVSPLYCLAKHFYRTALMNTVQMKTKTSKN